MGELMGERLSPFQTKIKGENLNIVITNNGGKYVSFESNHFTASLREMEVLYLYVEENLTTTQVAEALNISIRTVNTHFHNLISKNKMHSRLEAGMQAKKLELLNPLFLDMLASFLPEDLESLL